MTSFPAQLRKQVQKQHRLYEDRARLSISTPTIPRVTSLAMPACFPGDQWQQDALFAQDGVRASFDKLNACYKKAGIPDKCRTRMYDTPHEFNSEMQAEAWEWLKKWL